MHPFAAVTCLSFVCQCLCLPASPGVVHLFPNLFQVAPPSGLPLHVNCSEEMFPALQNIPGRKNHFLRVCAVFGLFASLTCTEKWWKTLHAETMRANNIRLPSTVPATLHRS